MSQETGQNSGTFGSDTSQIRQSSVEIVGDSSKLEEYMHPFSDSEPEGDGPTDTPDIIDLGDHPSSQGTEPHADHLLAITRMRKPKFVRVKRGSTGEQKVAWMSDNYANKLCDSLFRQQQQGLFTDFEIHTKPRTRVFKCHKSVLYNTCQYFAALFSSGMKESISGSVIMEGMDDKALGVILEFMYTGRMNFHECSIESLFEMSRRLQNESASDICCRWLIEKVSLDNCVDLLNLSDRFGMSKTSVYLKTYLLSKFVAIADKQLLNMSASQLRAIVASDYLLCFSELEVFKRVDHWIKVHDTGHTMVTKELISLIRFPLMKAEELVNYVSPLDYMTDIPECCKVLSEAKDYHLVQISQPCRQTTRTRLRHAGLIGMCVCLDDDFLFFSITSRVHRLLGVKSHELKKPPKPLIIPTVRVYHNFLYACGGLMERQTPNISTARCYRYNPRTDSWIEIASMNNPRVRFRLEVVDDLMFAIGGTDEGRMCNTYEVYDFASDTWTAHPKPSSFHQASRYPSCSLNHSIYVSGGAVSHSIVSDAFIEYRHDPSKTHGTLITRTLPRMKAGRKRHRMLGYDNKIFVIGGQSGSVEVFNVLTEQWSWCDGFLETLGTKAIGIIACLALDPSRVVIVSHNEKAKPCTCLLVDLTKNPATEKDHFVRKMGEQFQVTRTMSSFGQQLWMPACDLIARYPVTARESSTASTNTPATA